jgi:hypothetical protein
MVMDVLQLLKQKLLLSKYLLSRWNLGSTPFHGQLLKRFKISLSSLLEDALLVSHWGN